MAVVVKFHIQCDSKPFSLNIDGFCEVVHAGLDVAQSPCLWALVTSGGPLKSWKFMVVPTGVSFDMRQWSYLRTFVTANAEYHLLRPAMDWDEEEV